MNVIIDYSNTITAINQALNLSSTTNSTIQSLLGNVTQLMVDQLQSQASSLLATSEGLLVMAQQVNSSVALLLPVVATAQSQVMLAENRSRDAAQQAISLGMEVERLRIAAGEMSVTVTCMSTPSTGSEAILAGVGLGLGPRLSLPPNSFSVMNGQQLI